MKNISYGKVKFLGLNFWAKFNYVWGTICNFQLQTIIEMDDILKNRKLYVKAHKVPAFILGCLKWQLLLIAKLLSVKDRHFLKYSTTIFYCILKHLKFLTQIVFQKILKVIEGLLLKFSLASGEEKALKNLF